MDYVVPSLAALSLLKVEWFLFVIHCRAILYRTVCRILHAIHLAVEDFTNNSCCDTSSHRISIFSSRRNWWVGHHSHQCVCIYWFMWIAVRYYNWKGSTRGHTLSNSTSYGPPHTDLINKILPWSRPINLLYYDLRSTRLSGCDKFFILFFFLLW